MKLTRAERWILFNQFQILEKLGGSKYASVEGCRRAAEALSCGYELEHKQLAEHIYDERDSLSEDACVEVLHILSMYDALQFSQQKLGHNSPVGEDDVVFPGFDGNNEGSQMAYALFIRDGKRFAHLSCRGQDLNSHCPSLDIYRRMLAKWQPLEHRGPELSAAEMTNILDSRKWHP